MKPLISRERRRHLGIRRYPMAGTAEAVRSITFSVDGEPVTNPRSRRWVKRDDSTGRFADGKTSGGRFKGIRRER